MNLRAIQSYLTFRRAKAKCFAIILVLVGVMSHSVFDLAQQASATMCNPKSYTVKIIDQSVTGQSEVPSVEAVGDPHFRSFITSVTDHVLSKFMGKRPCQGNSDDEPIINLVFVRLPLVTSGNKPIAPVPSLDAPQSNVTCRLDSPWAKLTIRRSTSPLVRAVFIWNERQFLLDQVLLSGKKSGESHLLTVPLIPLTNRLFEQYARDYADSEILLSPSGERSQTTTNISKRIPADVLWLFRKSWQSTRGPFSNIARSAMTTTLERAAGGYTNLALALFDQCFASTQNSEQRYESILDVRDVISLNKYQIHQLN